MFVALSTVALSFSSCKDDKKDEPATSENTVDYKSIVGTWKYVDSVGDYAVLTLNSNHTGTISLTMDLSRATGIVTEQFNWNTSDDASANHWLEIIHTGGDRYFTSPNMIYILAGNSLQLDGFTYTRM